MLNTVHSIMKVLDVVKCNVWFSWAQERIAILLKNKGSPFETWCIYCYISNNLGGWCLLLKYTNKYDVFPAGVRTCEKVKRWLDTDSLCREEICCDSSSGFICDTSILRSGWPISSLPLHTTHINTTEILFRTVCINISPNYQSQHQLI